MNLFCGLYWCVNASQWLKQRSFCLVCEWFACTCTLIKAAETNNFLKIKLYHLFREVICSPEYLRNCYKENGYKKHWCIQKHLPSAVNQSNYNSYISDVRIMNLHIKLSVVYSFINAMDHIKWHDIKTTDFFGNLIGCTLVMITWSMIQCSNAIPILKYLCS